MEELKPLVDRHCRHLMSRANVVGVGLGYKESAGRRTDTKAVVILVSRKVHPSRLRRVDMVPKTLSAIRTDVIEVGDLHLLLPPAGEARLPALDDSDRTIRVRPACPGVSVGHYQVTAGTFGALVHDAETGVPMILSNNHVLANITDGRDGRAKAGDPVYQPGRYDGGTADDTIAHLERFAPIVRDAADETCPIARGAERLGNYLLRLAFPAHQMKLTRRSGGQNLVDAAVATLINPNDAIGAILGIGPVTGVVAPAPDLKIMKSGRTSGVTKGEVRLIGASVRIGLGDVGSAIFTDQIVTTAIAQPGDSGSLVVTQDGHQAVGLLSAGSAQASIVSRMDNVLEILGLVL